MSHTWLPVVSTSAPRSKSSSAICGRHAEAAGGVFDIDDGEVDVVRLAHVADVLAHDPASRAAEDVADEKDVQKTAPSF